MTEQKKLFTRRLPLSDNPSLVNKLCDIADWDSQNFREKAAQIMGGAPDYAPVHRKLWEFTQAITFLSQTGNLGTDKVGLSLAAGHERVLFYLANNVGRIVAADIYGIGDFSGLEAKKSFLNEQKSFAPYAYKEDALKVVCADSLNTKFPDNLFDFAICLSSIEHYGGPKQALKALQEMKRVVKPGGAVFFTTDCSLNKIITHESFRPVQLEEICELSGLKLYEPINYNLSSKSTEHLIDMRKDSLEQLPHLNLKTFGSVFTSIAIGLVKPGAPDKQVANLEEIDSIVEKMRASEFYWQAPKISFTKRVLRRLSNEVLQVFA